MYIINITKNEQIVLNFEKSVYDLLGKFTVKYKDDYVSDIIIQPQCYIDTEQQNISASWMKNNQDIESLKEHKKIIILGKYSFKKIKKYTLNTSNTMRKSYDGNNVTIVRWSSDKDKSQKKIKKYGVDLEVFKKNRMNSHDILMSGLCTYDLRQMFNKHIWADKIVPKGLTYLKKVYKLNKSECDILKKMVAIKRKHYKAWNKHIQSNKELLKKIGMMKTEAYSKKKDTK